MENKTPKLVIYDDSLLMTQEDWDMWGKLLIGQIRKDKLNYLLVEIDYGKNLEKE